MEVFLRKSILNLLYMDSNSYYRLRKEFSQEDSVEQVDYGRVDKIPDVMHVFWEYDVDGRQTISSYNTGQKALLVVFDNVEDTYAYWASPGQAIMFGMKLDDADVEPVVSATDGS